MLLLLILPVVALSLIVYVAVAAMHNMNPGIPAHLSTSQKPNSVSAPVGGPSAGGTVSTGATAAPAKVCGNAELLAGPKTPPKGSVRLPPGNNYVRGKLASLRPDTTYWFAPGKHTLGRGAYNQIRPVRGDKFIGAPGAVLSGQSSNNSAFAGSGANVTIKYLTIENFDPPGSQGAVNHDSARHWMISHNTIQRNSPGAALMVGSYNNLTGNCITRNGEYAFNAYASPNASGLSNLTGGPSNIKMIGNEISYNNTCNFEDVSPNPVPSSLRPGNCKGAGEFDGCGCAGGGKFWSVQNADIEDNYVHNNFDPGLWVDTNNNGFIIKNNYISDNYSSGIVYEISYNALIQRNTFIRNAIGSGSSNGGFPTGAIYVSGSGGDSRVPNQAGIKTLTISSNVFRNNWSGVVLWESSDRFCGSPNNSSTGTCTLVDRSVANIKTCDQKNLKDTGPSDKPDYYNLCRWETRNVSVRYNKFYMRYPAVPSCHGSANSCGENALFSQYGTSPSWSPYKGFAISQAVTKDRGNKFSHNTYVGTWKFMYHDQSGVLSLAGWRAKGED
jgi:hypothetical protein